MQKDDMAKFLLAVHVLAAILLVGPVAVAASLFPRFATPSGDGGHDVAALLHRICRSYAAVGVVVPVFGIATAARLGVLTDAWLVVSVVLTAAAAAVLGLRILPAQRRLLAASAEGATGLMTATGVFNLLWAVVVVLMILRPGSTTGA